MSFLMVGHTHEDIDQVFSRISAHLKKNSVYTVEGMKSLIPQKQAVNDNDFAHYILVY